MKKINDLGSENMANPVCKKCKNEISPIDIVSCPDCGRTYHSWCWKSLTKCITCGRDNENYSKEFADGNFNPNQSNNSNEIIVNLNSGMFSNIGGKIKTLATIVTIIGIIAGIITFISMASIDEDLIFSGLLTGGAIALVSWIGSFALYGFGALISSSQNTEKLIREVLKEMKK